MIVGVSGYGFTGASAAMDLLKEYKDMLYPKSGRVFEFCLPYEPDGLLDLEYHLTKSPAKHLKGDMAIYRFIQYTDFWTRAMNRETNGQFSQLTQDYINSLVQVTYKNLRASKYRGNRATMFSYKLRRLVQMRMEEKFRKRPFTLLKETDHYISVNPADFLQKTQNYIREILNAGGIVEEGKISLLDQPFPPNNPEQVFHFFDDPYAIVVDRDPRDIYLTVKRLRFTGGRFIPHDNVEDFVKYYRAVRSRQPDQDPSRVLRINFEDLLYNYEDTKQTIENFLGVHEHTYKDKYFKPELSIRNTQLKDVYPDEKENIAYIERELAEYLYPFEKYYAIDNREGIFEMSKW